MPGTNPVKPLHILMADDDGDDHFMFAEALATFKLPYYQLSKVNNGEEAINFLLKKSQFHSNQKSMPDFIVLDINMPKMDGIEVLKKFRELTELEKVPVFILSTTKQHETAELCQKLGAKAFYQKPAARSGLKEIIGDMLVRYSQLVEIR